MNTQHLPLRPELHPELLMPAGDFLKLQYALAYGADAVYAGVPLYSLRARENGFKNKRLLQEGIEYCRALGKKLYLTMNIYAHNSKIKGFLDFFAEMQDLGPDAFIMTDIGLIAQALKLRPNAVIHLSTQANVTNWTAVQFWKDLGVKRIILSRELSLKEIKEMSERVPGIELETFVHGAICIAYSGRCLISNYMNHRDANQGTCTNSCRWNYQLASEKGSLVAVEATEKVAEESYQPLRDTYYVREAKRTEEQFELDEDEHGTYMMNSKDLCAIELLKDLSDSGIVSFKVEGRTKSLYYLAMVTRAYRRAINDLIEGKPFNPDNLREVIATANRTLMTGFYLKRPNEYGENYSDGDCLNLTHCFAGYIQEYNPTTGMARIDCKNKISIGDTIEWVTPTDTIQQTISHIEKNDGTRMTDASGGIVCSIPAPEHCVPNQFTLIRKVLSLAVPTNEQTDTAQGTGRKGLALVEESQASSVY